MDLAGLGRTFPAEGLLQWETLPLGTHKGYPSRGWADRGWKAGRRMRRDPSEDLGMTGGRTGWLGCWCASGRGRSETGHYVRKYAGMAVGTRRLV